MIRAIIVGTDPDARQRIRTELSDSDVDVVGEATTGRAAARLASNRIAQVVLVCVSRSEEFTATTADEISDANVVRPVRDVERRRADRRVSGGDRLTPQELMLLALLSRGFSNKRLARELSRSIHTVKNELTMIYAKLSVRSRGEAIVLAHTHGLAAAEFPGGAAGDTGDCT